MITVVMNDAGEYGVLTMGTRLFDENGTEIKGVTLVELRAEVGEMWKIHLEATVKVVRASDPDAPKPQPERFVIQYAERGEDGRAVMHRRALADWPKWACLMTPDGPLSFDEIVDDIRATCRRHGVQIAVSGYDSLNVYRLKEGEDPLYTPSIDDYRNLGA